MISTSQIITIVVCVIGFILAMKLLKGVIRIGLLIVLAVAVAKLLGVF